MVGCVPRAESDVKLTLELSHLKQLHPPIICSHNETIFRDPGEAEVVGWFCLHEGKLFEVPLAVAVELEKFLSNHTQLGIVLRVKGYLKCVCVWCVLCEREKRERERTDDIVLLARIEPAGQ